MSEKWKDGDDLPLCKECFDNETCIIKDEFNTRAYHGCNYKCFACGYNKIIKGHNYCPNCGRKITGIEK